MIVLKILSASLGLIGSLILAYRVVGILEALALVAKIHEENINQLMNDNGISSITHFHNSTQHVEKAQKTSLLVIGFICIILSATIQIVTISIY